MLRVVVGGPHAPVQLVAHVQQQPNALKHLLLVLVATDRQHDALLGNLEAGAERNIEKYRKELKDNSLLLSYMYLQ